MIFARRQGGPFVALALILVSGCATGQRDLNARDYWPSGSRWKHAASRAVKDCGTWIPLAGAALGNFIAIFVHDAFLPADSKTQFNASLSRREVSFAVAHSF